MTETIRIPSGDQSLHVEVTGDGPPLVCGHGMLCSCRMFDWIRSPLSAHYRVIAVDFRGHGRSSVPADTMTLDQIRDDYLAVLDGLDLESAIIAGFSMGGMAALRLALQDPGRVRALILMNTTSHAQSAAERRALRALAVFTRVFGVVRPSADGAMRLMFSDAFIQRQPAIARAWQQDVDRMDRNAIANVTAMIGNRTSITARMREIPHPALVIGSTLDRAVPAPWTRDLAGALPHGRLRILYDVGHATPVERPEMVADLFQAFLWEIGHR